MNDDCKMMAPIPPPSEPAAPQAAEIMNREELNRMYAEVKKTLKSCSKNQLIQYVCALLVEKYVLTAQLQAMGGKPGVQNETVFSKLTNFFRR